MNVNIIDILNKKTKLYYFKRNVQGQIDFLRLWLNGAYKSNSFISLCTTVKDRFGHLELTFMKNIIDNIEYLNCEYLLLNYDCPDPRTEPWVKKNLTPYIKSGLVNYYYYPDAPKFDRAHARNMAFSLSKGDIICNIDVDNFIGPGFLAYVSAVLRDKNVFLCGPRDKRGLGGRLCIRRKDWEITGGYDTRFSDYGPEDLDLTNRLCLSGLKKRIIYPEKFCKTISHSDEIRTRYHTTNLKINPVYVEILKQNQQNSIVCPNRGKQRKYKVKQNFSKWIEKSY